MAIITSEYRKDKEQMIGLCEAASGIGLLAGPLMGSVLYEIGGYLLPFFTLSAIYLMIYPLISYTLIRVKYSELGHKREV